MLIAEEDTDWQLKKLRDYGKIEIPNVCLGDVEYSLFFFDNNNNKARLSCIYLSPERPGNY